MLIFDMFAAQTRYDMHIMFLTFCRRQNISNGDKPYIESFTTYRAHLCAYRYAIALLLHKNTRLAVLKVVSGPACAGGFPFEYLAFPIPLIVRAYNPYSTTESHIKSVGSKQLP